MSDTAAPALNLSVDEVLTTTRSVRKRLDLDRPKPDYGDERDRQRPRVTDSAKYLNEHMHEVPVLLIPCIAGRADNLPAPLS